jgi:uncharacterized membrane protein
MKFIRQDKKIVFQALISLPKNTISEVIEDFKIDKKSGKLSEPTASAAIISLDDMKKQDQNLLITLASNLNNQQSFSNEFFILILFNIFFNYHEFVICYFMDILLSFFR